MNTQRARIILDCDPGHDDVLAILLAAASPALDLLAITTVGGNQTLDKVTLNARRVCTVAGIRGVPIAACCAHPLARRLETAPHMHGETGLDGHTLGKVMARIDPRAVEALRRAVEVEVP